MAVFRIILLLVVLGSLALFALQNWFPVIPLVFLGRPTIALPLAAWIIGAIAAGATTSLLISGLFQISNLFGPQIRRTRSAKTSKSRSGYEANPPRETWQETQWQANQAAAAPETETRYNDDSQRKNKRNDGSDWESSGVSDWESDWVDDSSSDSDWVDDEEIDAPEPRSSGRDRIDYDPQPEPRSSAPNSSVYSYSYKNPTNSGAGKAESIYDAEYRVIIPPYQPPTEDTYDPYPPAPNLGVDEDDDEDWGDDDDLDDNIDNRPSPR